MSIGADIQRCLDAFDNKEDTDPADAIAEAVSTHGWSAVCDCLISILADDSEEEHWRGAMAAFWCAGVDKRPVPIDRLIALLHHRFDPNGFQEDNLVWSIASTLKKVSYLSDYRPLEDPAVARELAAIRSLR